MSREVLGWLTLIGPFVMLLLWLWIDDVLAQRRHRPQRDERRRRRLELLANDLRRVPYWARSRVIDAPDLLPGANPPSALLTPPPTIEPREEPTMGQHAMPAEPPPSIVGPPPSLRLRPALGVTTAEAAARLRDALLDTAPDNASKPVLSPFEQARQDYVDTGSEESFAAMLEHVTPEDQ